MQYLVIGIRYELNQDFLFANEVHRSLVGVLGLPEVCIGLGYNYINDGQADDELDMDQLTKVEG